MELQELYEHFEEEKRLFHGYASQVEYMTTMHYIHQYANTQAQILEIGAGCGAYSLALAKEGYSLTAVEPVKKHVQIMESRKTRDMDITILECDAAHLPRTGIQSLTWFSASVPCITFRKHRSSYRLSRQPAGYAKTRAS